MQVENFYSHIKTKDDGLRHYPNEQKMRIKLPLRALIVGPSSSGKTNITMNLIKHVGIWDKVVLLAKNLDEPLYQHLIDSYRKLEKKMKTQILLAITDIKDLPEVNDFDPKENTLLICDDFICEKASQLAKLEEIFIRGRKNGVSPIFLTQSYFKTPMMIRQNVNYIFIKKLAGVKDLKRILAEYEMNIDVKQLLALYNEAVKGDFTNFFLIEPEAQDPALMFRKNYEPFPH